MKSKPNKKVIIGTVVSDKMDKTVTVQLETRKRHPIYKKFVKKHSKVKVSSSPKVVHSHESHKKSSDGSSFLGNLYKNSYKKLLIIPILLLLFAIIQISVQKIGRAHV